MVLIRVAVDGDRPALERVYRAASLSNVGDAPLLLDRPEFLVFAGEGIADGRTVVAEIDGEVAGFATIDGDELEDLFVDPARRRRGIARQLVEHVAGVARDRGHRRLWVVGNHHAEDFYRAVGFAPAGKVRTELGTGLRMVLDLQG